MAEHTGIEWTDATWQPITGCTIVSPGCTNCYAMRVAGTRLRNHPSRVGLTQDSKAGPVWNGEVRFNEQWLDQPLRWKRARRIFVCAHGDLFHESVPDEWIDRVFAVMQRASRHQFQVLTKRAKRMRAYMAALYADADSNNRRWFKRGFCWPLGNDDEMARERVVPLPNVWLGVSAEDQTRADERIPELLATPAAVRFISAEPLLGPVDLRAIKIHDPFAETGPDAPDWRFDAFSGEHWFQSGDYRSNGDGPDLATLDWVIAGGESGPKARPMHPDWARSLRDQCAAAGVAFFFKQWGEWASIHQCGHLAQKIDRDEVRYGEWHPGGDFVESCLCGSGNGSVVHVGKKAAGRLLDGVTHDGMPG